MNASKDTASRLRLTRSTLRSSCYAAGSFVVLGVSLTDSAANLTTFRLHSRLANLTADPPSVRRLYDGYSLFTQYFEDGW
jgi:hypothetical protein